jgi:maltose O-acetyltransferase
MMTRTEKEKMLAGELYNADAPELQAEMAVTHKWLVRYNAALGASASDLRELLLERLAGVGEGAMIRAPFHCDYGFNIGLGAGVFLNFNCVILDVVEVVIGDKTQIGPGVQILTADHPRNAVKRASGLEFGRPIRIGRNVWIGGGAIILPGGRDYWRQCADRRRQCGHSRRACWRYCLRQSSALASLTSRSSPASAQRIPTARFY